MGTKRYLVTGAAGFIGARLVESLAADGHELVSVDSLGHFDARAEHRGLAFGTRVDREALFAWLERDADAGRRFDAIFHIGACSSTLQTDEAYLRRVNIEYSQKLWDFAARRRQAFVYASSAATYGDGEEGFADDEERISRLRPLNAYGRSKQIFDEWALAQEARGHHPPAWSGFKFFNVYGFGERHKGGQASVVLHAFDQIQATGRLRLFQSHRPGIAHGEQKRDFVAVEDVIAALRFAADRPVARGIYNLGSGQARTFLDLGCAVFRALGRPEAIDFIPTPEAIRDKYQYFTEARMERLRAQGYDRPFLSLEEGVARYVARLP
jgi:ADP-L-glycero-D-manno-heptose 6-epimerase